MCCILLFVRVLTEVTILSCFQNQCSNCSRCTDTLDCYVIDSSGYILVADNQEDTGRFFGEIEGDIMDTMLAEKIFKKITVYDYQALCKRQKEDINGTSAGTPMFTVMKQSMTIVIKKMGYVRFPYKFFNIHITQCSSRPKN